MTSAAVVGLGTKTDARAQDTLSVDGQRPDPIIIATPELINYYSSASLIDWLRDAPDSLPTVLVDRSMMAPLIDVLERLGIPPSIDNLNDVFREYRHLTMEQGDQIFRAFRSIRQNFPILDQAQVSSGSTNDYANSIEQLNFLLFLSQKIRNEQYASFAALDNASYRIVIIPGPDFQFKALLGKLCGSTEIISDEVNQHSNEIGSIIARHEIAHRKEPIRPISREHPCHEADIFNRERAADRAADADQSNAYSLFRFFSLPHIILPNTPEIPTHALANLPDPRSNHYSPLVIAHDHNTASALIQILAGFVALEQVPDTPDDDGLITLSSRTSITNEETDELMITNGQDIVQLIARPLYDTVRDDSSLFLLIGVIALVKARTTGANAEDSRIDYPLFYDLSRALLFRMKSDPDMDQLPITIGVKDLLEGFVESCQAFMESDLLRPNIPAILQAYVDELPIDVISQYLSNNRFTPGQMACLHMPPITP